MSAVYKEFEQMGANITIRQTRPRRSRWQVWPELSVDVQAFHAGESFVIRHDRRTRLSVLDTWPEQKQLLLNVHDPEARDKRFTDARYLCGFDERHWFAAAIPETANALTVQQAMDALKPKEVWDAIKLFNVAPEERNSRFTTAFTRQGEWFFVRRGPEARPPEGELLRNEPLQRNDGGKPHLCDELIRDGGERVLVNRKTQEVVSEVDWLDRPEAQRRSVADWNFRVRDPRAYARGAVKHSDHDTIWLDDWHQIVMNTEAQARARANLAFLD